MVAISTQIMCVSAMLAGRGLQVQRKVEGTCDGRSQEYSLREGGRVHSEKEGIASHPCRKDGAPFVFDPHKKAHAESRSSDTN
jgi:hypothetical protein